MELREDIAKLDRYIEQMDFLYQHKIGDTVSLQAKKNELSSELKALIIQRRKIYTIKEKAERHKDVSQITQAMSEISVISGKISEIRKQISLCEAVSVSSERVSQGLEAPHKIQEIDNPKPDIKKRYRS